MPDKPTCPNCGSLSIMEGDEYSFCTVCGSSTHVGVFAEAIGTFHYIRKFDNILCITSFSTEDQFTQHLKLLSNKNEYEQVKYSVEENGVWIFKQLEN